MGFRFFLTSVLLGIGLAMDACAVSIANGLNDNKMKKNKMIIMALSFAVFQAMMPLIGYLIGHAFIDYISAYIPFIALGLLSFLGIKSIIEGIKKDDEENDIKVLTVKLLLIQSVATSIDALSVGLTIANYSLTEAIVCALIIALMTFIICFLAVLIGKKFGSKLGDKAVIVGGIILLIIGIEIFLTGIF